MDAPAISLSAEEMLASLTGRPVDALRRDLGKVSSAESTTATNVTQGEAVQRKNEKTADRRRAIRAVNGMGPVPTSGREKAAWAVRIVARAGLSLDKRAVKELQRRVHPDKQLKEDKSQANKAFQRLRDVEEGLKIEGVAV